MKQYQVQDLMVPLREYATVSVDATLYEAVVALEEAQQKFDQQRERHRAILVLDQKQQVVGKLSQIDVLRCLEPKYEEIGDLKAISRYGFSREFVKSMLTGYGLWEKPLQDICRKAARKKVQDIMDTPGEGEYVPAEATLDEAIHQLVMGHHQSLLVTRNQDIVGILRLSDVFREICKAIKACNIE